jgi:Predicted membrane protein
MDNQNLLYLGENSDINLSKVFICRRLPERTSKIGDRYFSVCLRCTWIYIGLFYHHVFVYFIYIPYTIEVLLAALQNLQLGAAAILMTLSTFSDSLTYFGLMESNNTLKFCTGLCTNLT